MTRLVLIALLLLTAPSAAFATTITKDMANSYYSNCVAKNAPGISQKSKEYMCACTAAKMMDNLSLEDIQAMNQQNQAGRLATNKMLIDVYAPCIEFPAYDYYYNNCITDPNTKTMTSNPQRTCSCLSDQVAAYLKGNAQTIFRDILMRDPNITDPMAALTNDPRFQQFARSKLLGCVVK